jgi:hypothetical protein
MIKGGNRGYEPVSLSKLEETVEDSKYSATISAPRYTEMNFNGPGLNWTGDETYLIEASLVMDGKGPELVVNMSADRELM